MYDFCGIMSGMKIISSHVVKSFFLLALGVAASLLPAADGVAGWLPPLPAKFASGTTVPSLESVFPRAVLNTGSLARFERVWQRLAQGEKIRIVTIGGSITQGAAASKPAFRWADQAVAGWRRAFPNAEIDYVNCGIGATGSELAAYYLSRDILPKKPDVVFIEFSVNDARTRDRAESMEGVVRQLLSAPGDIAVLMLGMMNEVGDNAQAWHGQVARHYQIPYISYRDALASEMNAGRIAWTDLSPDTIHPNDVGHAYAAALVNRFLSARCTAFLAAKRAPAPVPPLPAPCFSDTFAHGAFLELTQVKILENRGFTPCREIYWGQGLACSNAASRLVFEVDGATVGLVYRLGKKPHGIARVKIDGRVVVERLDGFRDQWWWYTPSLFLVRDQPGRHVVEIETLAEKNPASAGFGFQVCAVLLGPATKQACAAAPDTAPWALTVEHLPAPAGVDVAAPRFAWKQGQGRAATAKNVVQTAYRILVASSRAKLDRDEGDLWDTGKVSGAQSIDVVYAGRPLVSSQHVYWKVKTWCSAGVESAWSAPQTFVTGILNPADWKAKWIGPAAATRPDADLGGARWVTGTPDAKGVVTLKKAFTFTGAKPGEFVEFLHAGFPQHEIDVNGTPCHRWSGHIHDPKYLRFRDITAWLKPGVNEITVRLHKPAAGQPQAFLGALRLPDGTRMVTDASWGTDLGGVRDTPYGRTMVLREEIASPAFEKTIQIAKPLASAILHITGVGFYEASLNGKKIGDKVLDPSPTAYDKHVLYSTYDLAGLLKPGANTLNVLVGHGWYDVRSIATWNFDIAPWRDFPRMIAQLELVYADGTRETVVSDKSWRQVASPVGYDCIREGEVVGGFDPRRPDLEGTVVAAEEVVAPKGRLVAENCAPAKVMRELKPTAIHAQGNGVYVVEFPENFAGWIRMNVRGQRKGDVLVIRYDERIDKGFKPAVPSVCDGINERLAREAVKAGREKRAIDCHFRYTASQRVCATGAEFQADRFISAGVDGEVYEPRFTYNGFQYVVLTGLRQAPQIADITGCIVHTAFPTIGSFTCSDETFNTLMQMGERAYKSNFADGVPTDCPHREKNGWTGDASIASELAQYCFENTAAYEKWLRDLCDSQLPSGDVCCIIPTSGWGFVWGNGPAWDSALPVIAWNLWCYRGDRRVLDAIYPTLRRYVDFTTTKATGHLVKHGLGDWIPVNRSHMPTTELTSSCYYYQAASILSRIAGLRGEKDVEATYATLTANIAAAINKKYYKGEGVYDNGGQTAQAFPLAYGIVPAGERAKVEAKLVESVLKTDGHVDMGLLGTKHVFRALSLAGRTDLAFKMLTNPTAPSPVEWMQKGGTTLWEDWGDGASRNHIMFGDFMAWAYEFLAGIRLPETARSSAAVPEVSAMAFKEIIIAPQVIAALDNVRATVDGPYGVISSAWTRTGSTITLEVVVPPNTTARVCLPDGSERRVGSGAYTFTCAASKR